MKKQALYMMAVALCGTLALASCSNEADEPVVAPAAKQVSLTLTLPGGANTRTTYTEKKNGSGNFAGLKTAWAEGDKVTLVKVGSFSNLVTLTQTGSLAEGATTATFTGEISPLGEISESTTLLLFYPEITDEGAKCVDYRVQDGTLTNLGKYDLMADFGIKYKDGKLTPSTAGFDRRSTFIRLPKGTPVGSSGSIDIELYGEKDDILSTNAPLAETTYSVADGKNNIHVSTIATDGKLDSDVYIAFGVGEKGTTKVYLKIGDNIYEVAGDGISFALSKMYTITDLSKYKALDDYIDLSAAETANCYLVPKAGSYKFKATLKGNGSADLAGISKETDANTIDKEELIWATFNTDTAPAENELIQNIYYQDGYVFFSSGDTYKEGNALVAIKDASDNILWSWHLWFESDDLISMAQTYPNSNYVMMDRNLGALTNCYNSDNALDFGFAYQNGRKDPFMMSASRTIYKALGVLGTYTSYGSGSVASSILNPTKVFGYDNWGGSPDYWTGSDKTIFDPCPPGWRVAPSDAWSKSGFNSTTFIPKDNDWDTYHGWVFNNEAWFPATGDRWGSAHNNTGVLVRVWARGSGMSLAAGNGGAPNTGDGSNPGHGYSVRPVKE